MKDNLIRQLTVKLQEQTKKAKELKGRVKGFEDERKQWQREYDQ
jgi:hypothetical protein